MPLVAERGAVQLVARRAQVRGRVHTARRSIGRVRAASLIRYLREDDARRQTAADALAAETRELGFA